MNGTWPGPTQALLSAPVYADTEPEPREDRGALRVDDQPARPWEGSSDWDRSSEWDRSFGWERASGTAELVPPPHNRRGANDTLLLEEELPATWRRPDSRRGPVSRRTARMVVPVIVLVAVAAPLATWRC